MKKLELQNFGVVEMNNDEMKEVLGGVWPAIVRGAIALYKIHMWMHGSSEVHYKELQDHTKVVRNHQH